MASETHEDLPLDFDSGFVYNYPWTFCIATPHLCEPMKWHTLLNQGVMHTFDMQTSYRSHAVQCGVCLSNFHCRYRVSDQKHIQNNPSPNLLSMRSSSPIKPPSLRWMAVYMVEGVRSMPRRSSNISCKFAHLPVQFTTTHDIWKL